MIPTLQAGQFGRTHLSAAGDPYWSNTVLRLDFDGQANGATTLVDKSQYAGSAAISSNASIYTSDSKFGTGCLRGTIGEPSIAAFTGTHLRRGSGVDCTIEFWFKVITSPNFAPSIGYFEWLNNGARIFAICNHGSGGMLAILQNTGGSVQLSSVSLSTWHFCQLNVSGNTIDMRLNGTNVYNSTMSSATGTATVLVGTRAGSITDPADYRVDDFRMTIGAARPFAVPTAAMPIG